MYSLAERQARAAALTAAALEPLDVTSPEAQLDLALMDELTLEELRQLAVRADAVLQAELEEYGLTMTEQNAVLSFHVS
jgi:hypothetical protein